VLDGMVWPDRRPKPAMWEHKRLAAPVRIAGDATDLAHGRIEIANHQHFTDLGWLRASYSLTADGIEVAGRAFDLPALGPGASAVVDLPGWVAPKAGSGEAFLTVRVTTAWPLSWAPRGFEICALQLPAGDRRARTASVTAAAAFIKPVAGEGTVPLDAEGRLVHPFLAAPPALSLWRAPTDNDRIGGMADRWRDWGVDRVERRLVSIEQRGATTVVRDTYHSANEAIVIPHEASYTRLAEGAIAVIDTFEIPDVLADLARVGIVLEVIAGPETLDWYGSGPHETYPDRKRSGIVGLWDSTVTDQYVPYLRPQENGGHADVRWLELTGARGGGVRIELGKPSQVSVSHLRAADLAAATHDVDVVPVAQTIVHLDVEHRGLGTASCGPDTLPTYLIAPGPKRLAWTLRDLTPY
jgi:beta-galactosidase